MFHGLTILYTLKTKKIASVKSFWGGYDAFMVFAGAIGLEK